MHKKAIRKISFVYPPYGVVKNEPGIKVVKENYGMFPSLSLAYVASVAEHSGRQIQFIDANALHLSKDQVVGRIKAFGPDLVAYTITTYLFHQTLSWIRDIKAATGIPTVVGGVHVGIYPKETLHHEAIDYGVLCEAEEIFPKFLDALSEDDDLSKVPGIVYRDPSGEIVQTENASLFMDVDNAPFPARHHLPNEEYFSFISKFKNFTALLTSRGCPFRCIFCEQGGLTFRPRSPGNICDEIQQCYDAYHIREFDFFDSSFTTDKKRVIKICEEIINRKQKILWAIRSRVDLVNEEMLKALFEAGCRRIYYGIESGDEQILETLNKKVSLDTVRDVMIKTRKSGIDTFGYFMVGSPGETSETVKKSIKLSLELDLDYAQFSKVTPMPATRLYEMLMEEKGVDYWRDATLAGGEAPLLPRPQCDMSDEEIQFWTRKAYLKFYFRPKYIFRALLRIKSWHELVRSVYTAVSMFWQGNDLFAKSWTKRVQY